MRIKTIQRIKKGDVITAEFLNQLVDAVNAQNLSLGQNSGLVMTRNQFGTALRVGYQAKGYPAVATSNISARSGTTAGTGTVNPVQVVGTTISSISVSISVLNLSSTTMTSGNGIDSGQYCWIQQDPDGNWIVTPMECS